MNIFRHWKSLLFALAIFVMGAVTGRLIIQPDVQPPITTQLSIEGLHAHLLELLTKELALTTFQQEAIGPILGRACEKYRQETVRAINQVNEIVNDTNDQIARHLTEMQIQTLNALEAERQKSQTDLRSRFLNE